MSTDEKIRRTLRGYQRAVTAEPANAELRRKLAGYLAALGYPRQAAQELELSTKLFAAQGDLLTAISTCKVLLRLDPSRTEVLLFLTRHYANDPTLAGHPVVKPVELDDLDSTPGLEVVVEEGTQSDDAVSPDELKKTNQFPAVSLPNAGTDTISTIDGVLDSIDLSVLTLDEELPLDELDDVAHLEELIAMAEHPADSLLEKPAVRRVEVEDVVFVEPAEIPRIPLLSSLPPGPFVEVLHRLELEQYAAGEEIKTWTTVDALDPLTDETFELPEPALHILVTGHVKGELIADDESIVDLGEVELGSFFGEFEVLTGRAHNVRMIAVTNAELLMLRKPVLDELHALYPQVREQLWHFYHQRLIRDLLANSEFFRSLTPAERDQLADSFEARTYAPQTTIVREGHVGDGLYLLRDGAVEVVLESGEWVYELGPGEFFGVHSLANDSPFKANVNATTDTTVLVLPKAKLMAVLDNNPTAKSDLLELADYRDELTEPMVVGTTGYSHSGMVKD